MKYKFFVVFQRTELFKFVLIGYLFQIGFDLFSSFDHTNLRKVEKEKKIEFLTLLELDLVLFKNNNYFLNTCEDTLTIFIQLFDLTKTSHQVPPFLLPLLNLLPNHPYHLLPQLLQPKDLLALNYFIILISMSNVLPNVVSQPIGVVSF